MTAAPVNTIDDALRQCGVRPSTLTPREKVALDRQGYVVFPDVMDDEWLDRVRLSDELVG